VSAHAADRPAPTADRSAGHSRVPLYGIEFARNPDQVYAQLRQHGPTAPVELAPGVPATLVTSYDTALDVLRDPETFAKDPRGWQRTLAADNPLLPMMGYRPNCQFSDGDQHARLRRSITESLSCVNPNALREHVEHSADMLINDFAPKGQVDLLAEYARPLPLLFATYLFGCEPAQARRLLTDMRHIFDGVGAEQANADLVECLRELVDVKRNRPGADLTSWLVDHPARLSDHEMLHQLVALMGAGLDAEQNLIANALRLLLSDDRFAGDLSRGTLLAEDAVDEVLWTDPPLANYAMTYPTRDVEIAGRLLPRDEPVVISLAAANTDPQRTAARTAGNRAHLAFGAGPHACPAQRPARLIASVAIEKLLDRLPEMRLALSPEQLVWRPGPFHRGLTALPARFPPVRMPVAPHGQPGQLPPTGRSASPNSR
jgi:cytochrome P450